MVQTTKIDSSLERIADLPQSNEAEISFFGGKQNWKKEVPHKTDTWC